MRITLIYIALIAAILASCNEASSNKQNRLSSEVKLTIHGLLSDTNAVSLRVMDLFGDSFYEELSNKSNGVHSFNYRAYRPIIAQLIINNRENNIVLQPDNQDYVYRLDRNGYLNPVNIFHEYINDLSYLSDQSCATQNSLQDGIVCIDRFIARKLKLLEDYRSKGMADTNYFPELTELYYKRYKLYTQIALNRRGYFEINENNSAIKDSISNMNMRFEQYQNSIERANALCFHALLDRKLNDDVKKYNYVNYKELYHKNPHDSILSTHILATLHDNPYRESSLIDSLKKNSVREFVNTLQSKSKTDEYDYNNALWVDEKERFISETTFQNKVSLINFWFPGCKPCISSIPQKNELVKHYSNQPHFQFINVNSDFSISTWFEYLSRYDMKGMHFYVPESLQDIHDDYYELRSFPTYMLIINGKVKRIEQYPIGSKELYEIIDSQLNQI